MGEPADWLGVDVGWVFPAADSDGTIYRWSKPADRRQQHTDITVAGPVKITRADGTTTIREPYSVDQLADLNARARDERYALRVRNLATQIVSKARHSDRGLALEDWSTFHARRTAWTDVYRAIIRQAATQGVAVRQVDRAWTSLTCPKCRFIDRVNRPDRNTFRCSHCGHEGQADVVAANNMRNRAVEDTHTQHDTPAVCANPACREERIHRNGRCLKCCWYFRRHGRYPTAEQIEQLEIRDNYREFVKANEVQRPHFAK